MDFKSAHVSNVFTNEKKRLPRWIIAMMMITIILLTTRRSSQSSFSMIKEDSSIVEKESTIKGVKLSFFQQEGSSKREKKRDQNLCFFLDEKIANTKHPLSHKVASLLRLFLSSNRKEEEYDFWRVTAIVSVGSGRENNFNPDAFQRAMFAPQRGDGKSRTVEEREGCFSHGSAQE